MFELPEFMTLAKQTPKVNLMITILNSGPKEVLVISARPQALREVISCDLLTDLTSRVKFVFLTKENV